MFDNPVDIHKNELKIQIKEDSFRYKKQLFLDEEVGEELKQIFK